jgi:gluconolactonase
VLSPLPPFLCALLLVACSAGNKNVAAGPSEAFGVARAIPSSIPFESLEGPFWVSDGGYLLFSDVVEQNGVAAKIYRFHPDTRTFSALALSDSPVSTNGLAVDGQGRLVACERWNGVLSRASGAARTIIADRSPSGDSLNAPNDVVVRADGNIYFSDSTWGAKPGKHAPTAVYRIAPDGPLTTAFQVDMPNGVALSPDGRHLYVGSDTQNHLWRLPLAEDGQVGAAEPFGADVPLKVPDGLCVDDLGRVYVTNNSDDLSAILVLDKDGHPAGRIPIPARPSNCTFGGKDRRTLYVTTLHAIYELRMPTPGLP